MILNFSSTGHSNETSKIISATATIIPPVFNEEGGKPEQPIGNNPHPDLPEDSTSYVEVKGPVTTKKETQSFGTLVINKAPNDQNTFEVGGGNGYNLTVANDFYVDGKFHSQNTFLIIVKGNLTINGSSYLGNKTIITVYGNAYFGEKPNLQNSNAHIYVAGNTICRKSSD